MKDIGIIQIAAIVMLALAILVIVASVRAKAREGGSVRCGRCKRELERGEWLRCGPCWEDTI